MRPLDRLDSIKVKLGVVIVATVAGTVAALVVARDAGLPLGVAVVLAAALGLAMVQLLARGMTSPLREMAAAASAMARGDYDRRVRATSRDEVGELARAFNAMAAELADVERMRRDLVANVSHELRTPIGALQALLENLADGIEPTDPAALRTALAQTERLGRLVEQLLDLSRLESGGLALEPVSFGVRALLEQATRECELGDRPVRLKVCVQPGDLRATGDPERMHQVVANLLDNAVRHSPPDGRVWLSAHADGARTRIEVADEGPGIAPHEAERVFERFYRADAARNAARAAVSASRSRAGSSTPTGARSAPSGAGMTTLPTLVAAWSWSCRRDHAASGGASLPRGALLLRELLGGRAGGPGAVGLGAPPRAAARRGPARRARARPRLRLGALRGRPARRGRRPGRGRDRRGGARASAGDRPGADLRLLEPDGSIPLEHGSVDLVWCSEVLEHVADGVRAAARGPAGAASRRPAARHRAVPRARARPPRSRSRASTPTSTRRASTCASTPAPRSPPRCGRPGSSRTRSRPRAACRCCASRSSRALAAPDGARRSRWSPRR